MAFFLLLSLGGGWSLNVFSMIAKELIEAWVKGWALARGVDAPFWEHGGMRVNVGWPEQKIRYVFNELSEGYRHLAATISEEWVFLKVCASPDSVRPLLQRHWVIQPLRYFMTHESVFTIVKKELPNGYHFEMTEEKGVTIARILTDKGDVASIGRLLLVDGYGIYDRIETHRDHRQLGLAGCVMQSLQKFSCDNGINKGVLVATNAGRILYEKLGWEMRSLYTTAVIPR